MASASAFSLNVKDYGVTTVVPDDDVARLMYYLHCVTVGVGLDFLPDDLVQYKQYQHLSLTRRAAVFRAAVELGPEVFIGKVLFPDDEGKVTGTSSNTFVSISAACDIVSLQSDIVIAGKVQNVTKVMFFKSSWLKKFYINPAEHVARAILGTNHCIHCNGEDPICNCAHSCERPSHSKCHPIEDLGATLIDFLMSPPASNSTPASRSGSSPRPNNDKQCNGCGRQFVTAIRYRCTVCKDYDLCSPCYNNGVHNLTHPFMQISKLGVNSKPSYIRLSPRSKAPTPSSNPPPTTTMPANRGEPPRNPPPRDTGCRLKRKIVKSGWFGMRKRQKSPFFYNSMSVTELRTFLKERGVGFGDALDKETLCRRAWDAHCDCMTVTELDTFLSNQNVSVVGCGDVNSRRQRAKATFEPPTKPSRPPASSDKVVIRFKKGDMVVLTGLISRGDMNGNTGTVVSVDHAGGNALVKVEALDGTFRIKLDNLKVLEELV